jgi:Domain of unknown function (DUF4261)
MTTSANAREPMFTAYVIAPRLTDIKLRDVVSTLNKIAPNAVVGDWSGPFTSPPTEHQSSGMISIDGIALSLLQIPVPLPPEELDAGPVPYIQITEAETKQAANCCVHILISSPGERKGRGDKVRHARAITLLTMAVSILTDAVAIKWADSRNLASRRAVELLMPRLQDAGGTAAPLWCRILWSYQHGEDRPWYNSLGMWAFGLPEIEFPPSKFDFVPAIALATSACGYIILPDATVSDGDTIDLDGTNTFLITEAATANSRKILSLSLVEAKIY